MKGLDLIRSNAHIHLYVCRISKRRATGDRIILTTALAILRLQSADPWIPNPKQLLTSVHVIADFVKTHCTWAVRVYESHRCRGIGQAECPDPMPPLCQCVSLFPTLTVNDLEVEHIGLFNPISQKTPH